MIIKYISRLVVQRELRIYLSEISQKKLMICVNQGKHIFLTKRYDSEQTLGVILIWYFWEI